jgi:hypothetical protein
MDMRRARHVVPDVRGERLAEGFHAMTKVRSTDGSWRRHEQREDEKVMRPA